MKGRETIGTFSQEVLIADTSFPVNVVTVTIDKTDEAKQLERGTILAADAETGKCKVLSAASNSTSYAAYVLEEAVETSSTSDVVGTAFQTGKFVQQSLKTADGYQMTQADIKALRDGGIYIENAMM